MPTFVIFLALMAAISAYGYYVVWSVSCEGIAYQLTSTHSLQGVAEITDISKSDLPPMANTHGFPLHANCQGTARTFAGFQRIHFYGWWEKKSEEEKKNGQEDKFYMASDPLPINR